MRLPYKPATVFPKTWSIARGVTHYNCCPQKRNHKESILKSVNQRAYFIVLFCKTVEVANTLMSACRHVLEKSFDRLFTKTRTRRKMLHLLFVIIPTQAPVSSFQQVLVSRSIKGLTWQLRALDEFREARLNIRLLLGEWISATHNAGM